MRKAVLLALVLTGCITNPDDAWKVQNRSGISSSNYDPAAVANTLQALSNYQQTLNNNRPTNIPANSYQIQPRQPSAPTVQSGILKNNYINGMIRYCVYTNGVVTSISSVDLCPLSNP